MSSVLSQNRTRSALVWGGWTAVIVGAILAVFWNDLQIIVTEGLVSEGYSYVLLLPFVVAYLIYRKRAILASLESIPGRRKFGDIWTVVGFTLMLSTFVVYFYASETGFALQWRLLMVPVFTSGLVLTLFGYRFWRVIAIPIAFLVFFEPYFVEFTNPYWAIIADISAIGSHSMMSSLGYQTQLISSLTGPTITSVGSNGATYSFDIGLGSSGLQALVGYTLFAVLAAYLLYGSIPRRAILFVLGYPLLVAMNILRIVGVIGLTNFVGQAAGSVFHLTGGLFLVFLGTILLLFFGTRFFRLTFWPSSTPVVTCDHSMKGLRYCLKCGKVVRRVGPGISRRRGLGLALVAVSVVLLFSIQTPAYAQSTSLNKVDLSSQNPAVLMQLLPQIKGWNLTYGYRDTTVQSALQEQAALLFYYQRNNTQGQLQSITAIVEIGGLYHTWQDSLVTHLQKLGLQSATVLANDEEHIVGSTTVPGNFFVFIRPQSTLVEAVLQWITRAPFLIGGSYEQEFVIMSIYSNVPLMYNTGLITNSSDYQQVLNVFMPFGQSIVSHWAPSNTVTYIHLDFPMSYALVGLVALPDALALTGYSIGASNRKRSVNGIVRGVASKEDIQLLESVRDATKGGLGLLPEIRDQLAKAGASLPTEELSAMLDRASEMGLLQPRIVELSEIPYFTWRLAQGTKSSLIPASPADLLAAKRATAESR
jgi:exosortase/archaeosortase family protein